MLSFSLHTVVQTEESRWCEVVHQAEGQGLFVVDVHIRSPADAIIGLKNWQALHTKSHTITKFQLHIQDKIVWGEAQENAFAEEVWDRLWSAMCENQQLPCQFTDERG